MLYHPFYNGTCERCYLKSVSCVVIIGCVIFLEIKSSQYWYNLVMLSIISVIYLVYLAHPESFSINQDVDIEIYLVYLAHPESSGVNQDVDIEIYLVY